MLSALITLIIYILVLGLVVWLVTYVIDVIPLPEPFNRVAKIVLMVGAIIVLIVLLLQFAGIDGGMPRLAH